MASKTTKQKAPKATKQKAPSKSELDVKIKELEQRVSESFGAPAHAIVDEKGDVVKIITLDDPISVALMEAVQEVVQHPTGDVRDGTYIAGWCESIIERVARKTGTRQQFVYCNFHDTDRLGQPFENENWVRVTIRVGDAERHTVLLDPTPED